jgi:hypothetical protein
MDASPTDKYSAEAVLERLNEEYIDAFIGADVPWYQDHLADDFICIEADGSVLDKEEFLRMSGEDPGCHEVGPRGRAMPRARRSGHRSTNRDKNWSV